MKTLASGIEIAGFSGKRYYYGRNTIFICYTLCTSKKSRNIIMLEDKLQKHAYHW